MSWTDPGALGQSLSKNHRLWLFLDYDGTLAEFAPNPDVLLPDEALIDLLSNLAGFADRLRLTLLSGRRLEHIKKLMPVPGILLAGTYGIEYKDFDGNDQSLFPLEACRPLLEALKQRWSVLAKPYPGFYLEDKGYAVALHARYAAEEDARHVIQTAAEEGNQAVSGSQFHLVSGQRFIEVAPRIADKGQSVALLIHRYPWPSAQLIYIGDDDKDEAAFQVIRQFGGRSIVVAGLDRPTQADARLDSPASVRRWLTRLLDGIKASA